MTYPLPTEIRSDGPLTGRVHPDDQLRLRATREEVAGQPGATATASVRIKDGASGWRLTEVTLANHLDDPTVGAVVMWIGGPEPDPSLVFRAGHDSLTALANRETLLARIGEGLADHKHCAVLYIDLDSFKSVNDTLGHGAGDRLLVAVADRLRKVVRPGDTVGRLGGDEFVIAALGVVTGANALEIAERVRAAIARPVELPGRTISVTASVGVALGCGHQTQTLLDEADLALYRAKGDGRNRVQLYHHDMGHRGDEHLERQAVLRGALEDGGMAATFQPVVELGTSAIRSLEARMSLRGADAVGSPGALLELAERSGLSISLGAGLLDLACQHLTAASDDRMSVSVPVSARQLTDSRLTAVIGATLDAYDLTPDRLCLDVSERTVTELHRGGDKALRYLRTLGVHLAVDDFGSDPGGAGLPLLRDAQVTTLKIAEPFVAGIGRQRSDTEVVRAFVNLGRDLQLVTVAKGVTTATQVEFLIEAGCDLGIGPYFGDATAA